MSNSDRRELVRQLLQQEKYGVLSTLSVKHEGWPFGSATPYALTATDEPLIFVSSLAEHTRNMINDPRVSLFIQDTAINANPQALARATLLGVVTAVPENELEDAANRYLQRFPEAAQNFQLGDFQLLKIVVRKVRYIGGFGEMFWIQGENL
ncbi:MAG TPA: pyridoxamine 5'-phosphate oxidase family protein [Blastocatellia bacterium]|nr:pyridoxamine 5'-phosphate oxidase family protein [Blastocatellia bacterium]